MLVQGWWVIQLLPDTPCCSLVWVSPRASYQCETGSQTLPVWHQFPFRHPSREVPVGAAWWLLCRSVRWRCSESAPKTKTPRWMGSGGGCSHCSKWKENVVCEREEIMRLKEIEGKKDATLLMEEMPQGFPCGAKEQAWQAVSESQCVGSGLHFSAVLLLLQQRELPQVLCTACPGVQQRRSWGANNNFHWPGWDQVCLPVGSHALINRLLYSLKECTSNQRHPYIVAAFRKFPHLVENRTGFPDQNTKLST